MLQTGFCAKPNEDTGDTTNQTRRLVIKSDVCFLLSARNVNFDRNEGNEKEDEVPPGEGMSEFEDAGSGDKKGDPDRPS